MAQPSVKQSVLHAAPMYAAVLILCAVAAVPAGCVSTGIAVKEAFGYAKREQLVDRVKDAKASQDEAKQQFTSALERFIAVTGFKGGDLEGKYNQLKKELERAQSRADTVKSRVASMQDVAGALFKEWQAELKEYKRDDLRAASERQLDSTRRQYDRLLAAMKGAESKMQPVLDAFSDQVLFLKHNLNAMAIASLQGTADSIAGDVSKLIAELDVSIKESNDFINQMQSKN